MDRDKWIFGVVVLIAAGMFGRGFFIAIHADKSLPVPPVEMWLYMIGGTLLVVLTSIVLSVAKKH